MRESDAAPGWAGGLAVIAEVGDRRIALPAAAIARILPTAPLWRPPASPPVIAGFLALGGDATPVLDSARLLGLGHADSIPFYAHILIVPALGAGLLVARAEQAIAIRTEDVRPIDPADTLNGCAPGVAEIEGQAVHLLAPAHLLAAHEAATLAAVTGEAQRRLAEWSVPA